MFYILYYSPLDQLNQNLRGICDYKKLHSSYVEPGTSVLRTRATYVSHRSLERPQSTVVKSQGSGIPDYPGSHPSSATYKLELWQLTLPL